MQSTTQKASNAVQNATDGVLQSAGNAVDTTKNFATESLDKAGDKVRELRRDLPPAMDKLTDKALELANKGKELASDASNRVRDQAAHYAEATERYVQEKPVQSVLMGVAAGAALATAALLATRKRD